MSDLCGASVRMLLFGLLLGVAPLFGESPESRSYVGQSLIEVLRDLQSRGLDLFFTSNLVRPEMRVEGEPTAGDLRDILDEILTPHGLSAKAGPDGRLVVVAGLARSSIRGVVRVGRSGEPLPGVRVVIPEIDNEALSGDDGSFLLADVTVGTYALEAHLPGFVIGRDGVTVSPRRIIEVLFELEPAPIALDEIVVTPSQVSLLREEPVSGLHLDRDDILALPHLGDDIFRAFTLLPGIAGEEVSARFNVRGGRDDEVLVLLDRVELFEPYHLKDYSSMLSIVAPRALREVNLITGGFPAQYGDRMSGVLDMSTELPEKRRTLLGLGTLSAEVGSSGTFQEGRGLWLGSARRGQLDLAQDILGQKEKPRYWDAFGKLGFRPRPERGFGFHVLHSEDRVDFFISEKDEEGMDTEDFNTSYGNSYLWLTHQAILGPRLFVDTVASFGQVDRDRRGLEVEIAPADEEEEDDGEGEEGEEGGEGGEGETTGFRLVDMRRLEVAGLKQDWSFRAGDRQLLTWGFEARRMTTDYDYFNLRGLDDPLPGLGGTPPMGITRFVETLRGEQVSVYLSDRVRPADKLTLELGLRYDEHTLTADRDVSPRLNLVYAAGEASTWRAAWGYFFQGQRPYELQVEDGLTELASAERTEQRVVGFEHTFAGRGGKSGLLLRIEAYQRIVTDPRPRFENVFEPISKVPELEPDRILIAPQRSEATGLEVFLRGSLGRVGWWVSYTRSRTEDLLEDRWVPRRIDQPHALSLDFNIPVGPHWSLNLAWRYHTGWPTTAVMGREEEDDEGEIEIVPDFGPLNAERLPDYHRLDLRASREWQKKRGVLGFFLEIQNVYDRNNIAGFDVDEFDFENAEIGPGGEIVVPAVEEVWGGILPSFGVTWQF